MLDYQKFKLFSLFIHANTFKLSHLEDITINALFNKDFSLIKFSDNVIAGVIRDANGVKILESEFDLKFKPEDEIEKSLVDEFRKIKKENEDNLFFFMMLYIDFDEIFIQKFELQNWFKVGFNQAPILEDCGTFKTTQIFNMKKGDNLFIFRNIVDEKGYNFFLEFVFKPDSIENGKLIPSELVSRRVLSKEQFLKEYEEEIKGSFKNNLK